MRIPSSLTDEFSLQLNKVNSSISDAALKAFRPAIQGRETDLIKLQHGPIEVERLNLFYLEDIQRYCKELQTLLKGWYTDNASTIAPLSGMESNPMKRLSIIFSTQLDNFKISCSFNMQHSSKKYYMLDGNIMSLKKELSKIDGEINAVNADTEKKIWSKIKEELKKRGVPVDDERYMTQISRDESRLSELLSDFMDLNSKYQSLLKKKESMIEELNKKKDRIAKDLEKFVVEANVIEPVLLDELGIATRKSGLFVYLDISNAATSGDLSRDDISNEAESKITSKLKGIEDGLNELMALHKTE